MLEDPTYESIVRWGEGGKSFVVLEAWEFNHPEFQANKKDSLDNIRRKAPAPRKTAQSNDDQYPAQQQMDLLNSQLMATQQQLQGLSERYQELAQGHVVLLQHVVDLQKFVKNHERVMHSVMGFLHDVDTSQRRNNRIAGYPNGNNMGGGPSENGAIDDRPSTPLQRAAALLREFSAENLPNKDLEQMSSDFHTRIDYSTPPTDSGAPLLPAHSAAASSANIGYAVDKLDLENMVYPVGATNGIDPVNSEHIHNIPYSLPPTGMMPPNSLPPDIIPQVEPPQQLLNGRKKEDSIWGDHKPRILLVEDDKVCARIGAKFLQAFECQVDTARDGLEAVNKMNTAANAFDLILMDIIMPHLDGVSATVCIREIRHDIPIIAMTSNIRTDDIDMYFRYGMNDVLPKPFTKEGMIKALEKHLSQYKKPVPQFSNSAQMPHPGGFVTPNQGHAPLGLSIGQLSAAQSIKDDPSPGKSPQTATSWHSPGQLQGASPVVTSAPNVRKRQYSLLHDAHTFSPAVRISATPVIFAPSKAPAQEGNVRYERLRVGR
ncbi:hypothetical protein CJF30_00007022 [Rutstroemia sp. NJR-2017a BBW]|nr:hypothetical protein CJF30_00007022 [Rutstroemia sp. NJR-2017a BBW]